jgi:transcriptional regulator with XRE-family HTH domain
VVGRYSIQGQSLIWAWREFKSLTQEEVAEKMGISQSAYSQVEKSDAPLRRATIQKIADALGVAPGQLRI